MLQIVIKHLKLSLFVNFLRSTFFSAHFWTTAAAFQVEVDRLIGRILATHDAASCGKQIPIPLAQWITL